MGFTLNGATTAHTVVLDPPEGWNEGAGVLELARPALVNTWTHRTPYTIALLRSHPPACSRSYSPLSQRACA